MHKTTRTAVALLFAAWSIDYLDRLAINITLPLIGKELGISYTQLGLVVSAFFVAYAIMQLPGGMLADRIGGMWVAVAGMLAWSVFTGLTALAFSFSALIACRILFGLAQGLFPGAAMKLLAERSFPEERMTANGWVNSSNVFGGILASLVAAAVLPFFGWRGMFLIISVLGVLIALAFIRWMPRPLVTVTPRKKNSRQTRQLLKTPTMWLYAVAFFGYDVFVWGSSSWGITYAQEAYGIAPNEAALFGVLPGLIGVAAIVLSGKIADKLNGRPQILIIPSMGVAIVLAFLVTRIDNLVALFIIFTLAGSVVSFAYTACFAQPLKHLDPQVSGIAAGMILTGGMVAGVVSPTLFGSVVDAFGWEVAWTSLAIGPVITILAALKMPRTPEAFNAKFHPTLLAPEPESESVRA